MLRFNIAMIALEVSPKEAAANSPINLPALKLSVAKVESAAVIGSSGVSRAMTEFRDHHQFFQRMLRV